MVKATRINGKEFYINPDLIEFIERTPDTVLTMTTGRKVVVEEAPEVLYQRIVEHKKAIFLGLPTELAQYMEGLEGQVF